MLTLFACSIAFLTTYLSMPLLRRLAWRVHLLDLPGGRKTHKSPTPLMGGVAIYLGLCVAVFLNRANFFQILPILVGSTLIFILGLVNDVRELKAQVRFFIQVGIALLGISMGLKVSFFGSGPLNNFLETIITIVWLVGVTNAYNYLDGLDGLAAGSAVINLICFAVILNSTAQYPLKLLTLTFASSIFAFLPYNLGKNKIFLGEAGSTLIGFVLASVSLAGCWAKDSIVKVSIPVLIIGVPIFDMIFTTVMRISEGKIKDLIQWLQYGGRDHFHHRLVDLGFKPGSAVLFIYAVTISLGISAIITSDNPPIEALMSIVQAAMIFIVIAALIVVSKRKSSGWG